MTAYPKGRRCKECGGDTWADKHACAIPATVTPIGPIAAEYAHLVTLLICGTDTDACDIAAAIQRCIDRKGKA